MSRYIQYSIQDPCKILIHFIIPEAQDSIALLLHPSVSPGIMTTIIMLGTIRFDHQLHVLTDKICDKGPKRLLFSEFIIAQLSIAQTAPEQTLLWDQLAAE